MKKRGVLKSDNLNVSTLFLMPITGIPEKIYYNLGSKGLINVYCFCENIDYEFPVLFLLFDNEKLTATIHTVFNKLKKCPNYLETLDTDAGTVVVFKIMPEFIQDYHLILNGMYSKTSDKYKNLFPQTKVITENGKAKKVYTFFYHIFNKTEFWKNILKEELGYSKETSLFDEIDLYNIPKRSDETIHANIVYS